MLCPAPPPFLLHLVPLADNAQLVHVPEAQLVFVSWIIRVHGVHSTIVDYTKLLLKYFSLFRSRIEENLRNNYLRMQDQVMYDKSIPYLKCLGKKHLSTNLGRYLKINIYFVKN